MNELPAVPGMRCSLIRCKSMLVYGEDFEQDPEYQAGQVDFWCSATGQALGPDGEEVGMAACQREDRACFHKA